MVMLLHGQVFGLCRFFDSLFHLFHHRIRLSVILVDNLQPARQLLQQTVVFVRDRLFPLALHAGQGRMPLQLFEQLCDLPLRAFCGLYQSLDPLDLRIV